MGQKYLFGKDGSMADKWINNQYQGVRFREHSERKYNRLPDRYFSIKYKKEGKPKEEI